uniref:Uncharacterized protein n=1 Tax=Arundo donax TaxID=35708 RepID=A0A0A8YKM5_ARUDO
MVRCCHMIHVDARGRASNMVLRTSVLGWLDRLVAFITITGSFSPGT